MKNGLGSHPWAIQRAYSMPLLCLLFDAEWWSTYCPPSDDEPTGGGSRNGRGPVKTIDARKMSDAAFMGLLNKK